MTLAEPATLSSLTAQDSAAPGPALGSSSVWVVTCASGEGAGGGTSAGDSSIAAVGPSTRSATTPRRAADANFVQLTTAPESRCVYTHVRSAWCRSSSAVSTHPSSGSRSVVAQIGPVSSAGFGESSYTPAATTPGHDGDPQAWPSPRVPNEPSLSVIMASHARRRSATTGSALTRHRSIGSGAVD